MKLRIEQQRKELAEYTQMSISLIINQVPQIVQGVLSGMEVYFIVAPLQLQALSTLLLLC
jgi:hypothetical protein